MLCRGIFYPSRFAKVITHKRKTQFRKSETVQLVKKKQKYFEEWHNKHRCSILT